MAELKPCPFCGGKAGRFVDNNRFVVSCKICSANVFSYSSAKKATKYWNRRAEDGK